MDIRKSLILHFDSLDVLDELSKEQIADLFIAIRDYNLWKDIKLEWLMKAVFTNFKNQFDRDLKKYKNKCEVNAENIKKRWNKNNTKNTSRINGIKDNTKNTYNDSNSNSNNKNDKESKNKYWEYKNVLLTLSQKNKLIEDFWETLFNQYIKIVDEAIQIKGYKYKDHNLVIRNWIKKDNAKPINDGVTEYEKQKAERLARYWIKDF